MVGLLFGRRLSRLSYVGALCSLIAFSGFGGSAFAQNQTIGAGLEGQALINFLQQNYTPAQTLGYDTARDTMYAIIDNNNGFVTGVYSGFTISLNPGADPSTDAFNKGINAEHTWPQSMGAGTEPQRSDLHSLFPAKSNVNSARNNDPLGEIDDNLTDTWYFEGSSQTTIPTTNIDLYAENFGSTAFEPREQHKGNAARAVFYFVAIYQSAANQAFYDIQKDDLYNWHYADPVDAAELTRSSMIAGYQGNENPFILDTSLVRRAFFPNGNTGGPDTTPPIISSIQAISVGANSATITWTTDEPSNSTVDYGLTTAYGSSASNGSLTTAHAVVLSGLSASTTYNYQVSSADGSANSSSSGNFTFTTTQSGTGGTGTILFSEIFYDTPGTDSNEEWIELYNGGSTTLDLGGYTITDNNGTGSSYTFPSGSNILPGSYFTVAVNQSGFLAIYGFDADLYGSIPALNNGGDALILTDGSSQEVDAVAWEGGASSGVPTGWGAGPTAATGESIFRNPVTLDTDSGTDWAVATNNGDPQTQASAPIVDYVLFSEIFYDTPGTDSEEEWIELYNPTGSQIDLVGYSIVDNNGTGATYTFPTGSLIDAGGYFTVAKAAVGFQALYNADASQYGNIPDLNNTGDALLLKNASGTTIDEVAWEGGATSGVPSGWGTGPAAATGESIYRTGFASDSDTDADWAVAINNGDPASLPLPDVTAPVITSVSSSNITETEATITWNTDEPASSQINYGTTTSYGSSSGSGALVTSHSVTLTGLTPGTDYFYQVASTDEANNTGIAEPFSFTTVSPPVSTTPDIMISEVYYDPAGNESNEEWIEFYNTTGQQINLSGWTLTDNNGSGAVFTFSSSHTINGNSFLTMANHRRSFRRLYGKNADAYVSLPALNNGGEALILKDASGNEIDAVGWEGGASAGLPVGWGSTSLPVASEGFTIYRSDLSVDTDTYADWVTSTNTGTPTTQSDGTFFAKVLPGDLETEEESLPEVITLANYPNPFNPTTNVQYTLPEAQRVYIAVYNMIGQEVAVLVDGFAEAGTHAVSFDASDLSSGMYIYQIRTSSLVITQKMTLIK
ncbi:MAG: lamin tail domain-containing protein [Balneola sp.]